VIQIVFEAQESEEGGYVASALGFPIITQGDNWEELKDMVVNAVRCGFEGQPVPAMIRLILVREEVLSA
jgi:hypothetical protein